MEAMDQEKIINAPATDCHCHLLPGVDDGPSTIDEAIEMAKILAALGFTEVYCTPHHIKGAYENHPEKIRNTAEELRETLVREGVILQLQIGVEYYLDEFLFDFLADPLLFDKNTVLLETHCSVRPSFLAETAFQIINRNKLRPLIAHPERYDLFDSALIKSSNQGRAFSLLPWNLMKVIARCGRLEPTSGEDEGDMLTTLRAMGCLFQGNIGSFAGLYGSRIRKRAISLLQGGFYDRLGSDAHRALNMALWLKEGIKVIEQEIGQEELARLFRPVEMPLADEQFPLRR